MTTAEKTLDFLRCTRCNSQKPLVSTGADTELNYKCSVCAAEFSTLKGVVQMISRERDQDTLKKFEHQWKVWGADDVIFGKTKQEYEDRAFSEFINPGYNRSWFKNKRVLEAGCGHGMMVDIFSDLGANPVGLELGDGVYRAAKRIEGKNATLVQGDILDVPFLPESFDYVWSNGVIHHTRDTRLAFKQLASVVKPGGSLDIWLYPKKSWLWEFTMITARKFTTLLPAPVLSSLCYLLVPLLYVVPTWSRTSPRTHTVHQCAQVIYDWLSPKYQSHHTFDEVKKWYEEEGFENIGQNIKTPLSMHGVKKSAAR